MLECGPHSQKKSSSIPLANITIHQLLDLINYHGAISSKLYDMTSALANSLTLLMYVLA